MANKDALDERVRNLVAGGFLGGIGEGIAIEHTRALWKEHSGHVTKYHERIGKFCDPRVIVDVCAISSVGSNGTVELKLSDFVCLHRQQVGSELYDIITSPVVVVATARSDSPVHLTSLARIESNDVLIKVFAWNASGVAVPNVRFDWRCSIQVLKRY